MNLLYYRTGFASNSSSLHSTWHVDDPKKIRENIEDMEFGWDNFVCSSRKGIRKYLAAQLIESMSRRVPEIVSAAVVRFLYPEIKVSSYYHHGEIISNIDHQSVWSLPRDLHGDVSHSFPSFQFIKDIEEYLVENKIAIVGGNDNEPIEDYREILNCLDPVRDVFFDEVMPHAYGDIVCVKDKNIWKTFNRKDGRKLRFSFNGNISYEKSSCPELIDLIISNSCSHGCPYCYRGCSSDQQVANIDIVKSALYDMANYVDVFEVAIGGGNIVEYPEIEKLCNYIQDEIEPTKTIVCNTTLNWKDFKDENIEKIKMIFSAFHGVAVSVSSKKEIEHVVNFQLMNDRMARAKLSFQCIPEIMSYKDINEMIFDRNLKAIPYSLTFLGFKRTGRGKAKEYSSAEFEKNKENFRNFINSIPGLRKDEKFGEYIWGGMYPRTLGVDTQLIHNFPEIKDTQEPWCYTENEGKFSCCIDLVSGHILPSSFSEYKDEYKMKMTRWGGDLKFDVMSVLEEIYPKF